MTDGRAKIKSTLNGGYYTPDDMDVDALRRLAKRRQREQEEDLAARGIAPGSKRITYMTPFNIQCAGCSKTIAKRTKLYASVSTAPEKYLGRVKVMQLVLKCPNGGCGTRIRLVVNPETMTYDVVEGGTGSDVQRQAHASSIAAAALMNSGGADEGGAAAADNVKQTIEGLTSFEDVRAMLFAESEAIDALGDSYQEESAQVQHIRQRFLQQMRERAEQERSAKAAEEEELRAEFERVRREMLSTSSSSSGADAKTESGGIGAAAAQQQRQREDQKRVVANALAETKALFAALERVGAPTVAAATQQQQQQQQAPPQVAAVAAAAAAPAKPKKKGLLDSMFSDDDDA